MIKEAREERSQNLLKIRMTTVLKNRSIRRHKSDINLAKLISYPERVKRNQANPCFHYVPQTVTKVQEQIDTLGDHVKARRPRSSVEHGTWYENCTILFLRVLKPSATFAQIGEGPQQVTIRPSGLKRNNSLTNYAEGALETHPRSVSSP